MKKFLTALLSASIVSAAPGVIYGVLPSNDGAMFGLYNYKPITAQVGDTVTVTALNILHGVRRFTSQSAFNTCDFKSGSDSVPSTVLTSAMIDLKEYIAETHSTTAPPSFPGGDVTQWTYTVGAGDMPKTWFGCPVGDHCEDGMKFPVNVVADTDGMSQPVFPQVDDSKFSQWGFGGVYKDMSIFVNDKLYFKKYNDDIHDVWVSKSNSDPGCDFSKYTEIGNPSQVEGGVTWSPNGPGDYYFACSCGPAFGSNSTNPVNLIGEYCDNFLPPQEYNLNWRNLRLHCKFGMKFKVTVSPHGKGKGQNKGY